MSIQAWGQLFPDTHSITVSLSAYPTHSYDPGLRALVELLTHRCIYGLAMIWELVGVLGKKRIFSIIME